MVKGAKVDYVAFKSPSNELNRADRNRIESYLLEDHDDMETQSKTIVYPHRRHSAHVNQDIKQSMKTMTKRNLYYRILH